MIFLRFVDGLQDLEMKRMLISHVVAAIGFDVGRCRSVYQRHMLTADYL